MANSPLLTMPILNTNILSLKQEVNCPNTYVSYGGFVDRGVWGVIDMITGLSAWDHDNRYGSRGGTMNPVFNPKNNCESKSYFRCTSNPKSVYITLGKDTPYAGRFAYIPSELYLDEFLKNMNHRPWLSNSDETYRFDDPSRRYILDKGGIGGFNNLWSGLFYQIQGKEGTISKNCLLVSGYEPGKGARWFASCLPYREFHGTAIDYNILWSNPTVIVKELPFRPFLLNDYTRCFYALFRELKATKKYWPIYELLARNLGGDLPPENFLLTTGTKYKHLQALNAYWRIGYLGKD